MVDNEELLPCCPEWRPQLEELRKDSGGGWRVLCYGYMRSTGNGKAKTAADATAAWNTRPTEGPETVSVEGLVESVAEAIYEKMPFSDPGFGVKPKWAIGGNSNKQYEARTYAKAALQIVAVNVGAPLYQASINHGVRTHE